MRLAWTPLTLRQLLGGTYLAGILLLAVGVVFALGRHLDDHFRRELSDRGRALVERLAEDSRLALIQSESDSLRPRLETALTDPNVAGIVVATARGETLVSAGQHSILPSLSPPAGATGDALRIVETAETLILVATVRSSPPTPDFFARRALRPAPESADPLGFVTLTLTKAKLRADLHAIDRYVLAVMGVGALLVTLLALGVLDRLTRPIKRLAHTMADPETATRFHAVEVRGVREARVIASAYNALIARVAETNHALRASNAALTASRADLAQQVEEAVREVKRQNAELVVARERAEAASCAKSLFIANVSHETRTPMHGLLGALSLLEKTPLSDKQKSHLVMMREDADRLLREMNSILDFSQLEAHRLQLRERPCHLKNLLEHITKSFEARAWAKKLPLTLTLDSEIPAWVRTDDEQLEKIMRNLIDNAIKFTAQGQIQIRVWGQQTGADTFDIRLSVGDTGIGIPLDQQANLFEAFTQVDSSTTRQYGGNGLGLAICRQLVDLMKGRIALKSQPGKGSTFAIELPFALSGPALEGDNGPPVIQDQERPQLIASQDEAVSERRFGKSFHHGSRRVLVVDDERQSRLYAQFVLLELNAEVVTAANGAEALAACAWQRFDLILMDVRMPDLDGLETARRLRQQRTGPNARTPIVGLTADVLNLDQQDWQAAGMNACHHKPLEFDVIAEIFTRWGMGPSTKTCSLSAFLGKHYER